MSYWGTDVTVAEAWKTRHTPGGRYLVRCAIHQERQRRAYAALKLSNKLRSLLYTHLLSGPR